jgi:hypothetical protein
LSELNEIQDYVTRNLLKNAQILLCDSGLEVVQSPSGWCVHVYLPSEFAQEQYRRLWVPAALVGVPLASGDWDEMEAYQYAADNLETLLARRKAAAQLYSQGLKAVRAPAGMWHFVVYQPDVTSYSAPKDLIDVPVSVGWPSVVDAIDYALENLDSLVERRQSLEDRLRELNAVGYQIHQASLRGWRIVHGASIERAFGSKAALFEASGQLLEEAKARLAEQRILSIGLPEELCKSPISDSEQKFVGHLKSWMQERGSRLGQQWVVLCGEAAQRIASSALIAAARESQPSYTPPRNYLSAWDLLRDGSLHPKLATSGLLVLDLATLVPNGTSDELAERLIYLMLPGVVNLLCASPARGDRIIVSRTSAQTVKRPLRALDEYIQDRFIDVDGVSENPFLKG